MIADFSGSLSKQTALYVGIDDKLVGIITFTDTVRPESKRTIQRLQQAGITSLVMLTGDKEAIAQTIAQKVGLTKVYADCLPQDKIVHIKTLSHENGPVMMVGDGVNDAPALATADIGIAMGSNGASAASDSADVVILKDDLSKVADIVFISKHTMTIAKQSVLLGLLVCVVLMVIASFGIIPTLIGAMLQEIVDTVSILSALRARRVKSLKK